MDISAMLTQLGPKIHDWLQRVEPLLNQPVLRLPYAFPLVAPQTIPAGTQNAILNSTSFNNNLEYPFELHELKFSQDPAHTFQDWQVAIQDQTFNQPLSKSAVTVANMVDDNTGKWKWGYPWIIRPKGGAFNISANNLDTVNPITVEIGLLGYLLIPAGNR